MADGSISDDEEDAEQSLMTRANDSINELIAAVAAEADRIGGPFRSAGIKARVFKMMANRVYDAR